MRSKILVDTAGVARVAAAEDKVVFGIEIGAGGGEFAASQQVCIMGKVLSIYQNRPSVTSSDNTEKKCMGAKVPDPFAPTSVTPYYFLTIFFFPKM